MKGMALMCWHDPGTLVVTRLKWVWIFNCVSTPKALPESSSSQNETFQEKEMKMLSTPLFHSPFLFFLWNTVQPPSCFYYSHTLTHCFTPWAFFPVLSHLSLLSSPGTSMCFSLIEMHFNVVQISFLQLWSKLAPWFLCACSHNVCACVCVWLYMYVHEKSILTEISAIFSLFTVDFSLLCQNPCIKCLKCVFIFL